MLSKRRAYFSAIATSSFSLSFILVYTIVGQLFGQKEEDASYSVGVMTVLDKLREKSFFFEKILLPPLKKEAAKFAKKKR